jgi:hypothetical protein
MSARPGGTQGQIARSAGHALDRKHCRHLPRYSLDFERNVRHLGALEAGTQRAESTRSPLRLRLVLTALLTLELLSTAPPAYADDDAAPAQEQQGKPSDEAKAKPPDEAKAKPSDEARPSTQLDPAQRGDPGSFRGRKNYATAGETLSWIPRILFFPVYLVTEYLIRQPSVMGTTWVDRNHVIPILNDVFNPTPDIHWQPRFTLDLGTFAAFGAEGSWNNFLVRGHEISGYAETSGVDAFQARVRDSWKVGPMKLGAYGHYLTRDDMAFYGFGPDSSASNETYFSQTTAEAFAFAAFDYRTNVHAELGGGFRDETSGSGLVPSINSRFWPQLIPGLGADLGLAMATLDVTLDSRMVADQAGGIRLLANGTYARDVRDSERSFVSASVDVQGAIEVSRPDRVLILRGYAVDTCPLGSEPVPFMEQPMLGWFHHFGFRWGRFRDEAAVMAELRYRYPIAYFVDMQWVASVGNVFSRTFDDFDFKKLTTSIGVGLRTRRTGRTPLEIIFALGTTRFDEAFSIQSARVYFSTTEAL